MGDHANGGAQRSIRSAAAVQMLPGVIAAFAFIVIFVTALGPGSTRLDWYLASLWLPGVALLALSFPFYRRRRWAAVLSVFLNILHPMVLFAGVDRAPFKVGEGAPLFLGPALLATICTVIVGSLTWSGRASLR